MDLIELGIEKRYIKVDIKNDRIEYFAKEKYRYKWSNPEEKVRAKTFIELIEHYGYSPENIAFEVLAQQGSSGKTRADLVIYKQDGKAFAVIELKES